MHKCIGLCSYSLKMFYFFSETIPFIKEIFVTNQQNVELEHLHDISCVYLPTDAYNLRRKNRSMRASAGYTSEHHKSVSLRLCVYR